MQVGDRVEYLLKSAGRSTEGRREFGVIIKDSGPRVSIKVKNRFGEWVIKSIPKNQVLKNKGAKGEKNKLG